MRYTRERKCNPLLGLWSPAERHGFNKKADTLSASKQTPEIRLKLPVAIALGMVFIALLAGLVFTLMQTPDQTQGAAALQKTHQQQLQLSR